MNSTVLLLERTQVELLQQKHLSSTTNTKTKKCENIKILQKITSNADNLKQTTRLSIDLCRGASFLNVLQAFRHYQELFSSIFITLISSRWHYVLTHFSRAEKMQNWPHWMFYLITPQVFTEMKTTISHLKEKKYILSWQPIIFQSKFINFHTFA